MKKTIQNKAFTLIELLVVIAIIGILSTVSVTSLNSARLKARDAVRHSDIAQVRTLIELYYDDNEEYPASACVEEAPTTDGWSTDLMGALVPDYVDKAFQDPKNTGSYVYQYCRHTDGRYRIHYVTEAEDLDNCIGYICP